LSKRINVETIRGLQTWILIHNAHRHHIGVVTVHLNSTRLNGSGTIDKVTIIRNGALIFVGHHTNTRSTNVRCHTKHLIYTLSTDTHRIRVVTTIASHANVLVTHGTNTSLHHEACHTIELGHTCDTSTISLLIKTSIALSRQALLFLSGTLHRRIRNGTVGSQGTGGALSCNINVEGRRTRATIG